MQAPGVGCPGGDGLRAVARVELEPRNAREQGEEVGAAGAQELHIAAGLRDEPVAQPCGAGRSGAGCALPLRLGGQAIAGAGQPREQRVGAAGVDAIFPAVGGVGAAHKGVTGGQTFGYRQGVGVREHAVPVEPLYRAQVVAVERAAAAARGGLEARRVCATRERLPLALRDLGGLHRIGPRHRGEELLFVARTSALAGR